MDNFNKEQQCFCQYCGKECKSLNSLKQHEIRCKYNLNAIKCNGQHKSRKGLHLGYHWVTNDIDQKFVNNDDLIKYLNNGWHLGVSKLFKETLSKSLKGKSSGKASTIEKEILRKEKISNSMKGNKNLMYNKTRGNGKKGWYNNIFCDSTWELAFLVFYKEHNLNIQRCTEKFEYTWNNEKHIYIPDFITDEGIIEIKGRKTKQSEEKHKQFPNIILIDYNLMKPYLNYVQNKYGENFWEVLYENNG